MAAVALSKKQLKQLRALAHDLDPVVQVGKAGVTDPVVAAVGQALRDHELIKVRLLEPEDKRGMAAALAERSTAALCGLVGHTVILYRKHPKKPRIAV
jgi:RNA-binding protein